MDGGKFDIKTLFEMGIEARRRVLFEGLDPDQVIGDEGAGDYLHRWFLMRDQALGCMYLHRFLRTDHDVPHDHPWDNLSVVLEGGYRELDAYGVPRLLSRGSYVQRQAEEVHRIEVRSGPVWTLFVTGPKRRSWYFWPRGEDGQRHPVPWREYLGVEE